MKAHGMSDLVEIQSQIDKLQKQASEIRIREFDKTVQEILAKMNAFGISIKDLQGKKPAGKRKSGVVNPKKAPRLAGSGSLKVKSKRAGTVVAPKYRGPDGQTWSGRGLMPRWLAALVAQGQSRDQFLIGSP